MNDSPERHHHVAMGAETLVEAIQAAAADGYDTTLTARAGGDVHCGKCRNLVNPAAVTVKRVRRLEGASDVADMAIVAWVTCPVCGANGVLTLGYGPNASDGDLAVLPHLDLDRADSAPSTGEED